MRPRITPFFNVSFHNLTHRVNRKHQRISITYMKGGLSCIMTARKLKALSEKCN
ncbi:hypothetical protein ABMB67_000997 [Halalkalibacter oceani]